MKKQITIILAVVALVGCDLKVSTEQPSDKQPPTEQKPVESEVFKKGKRQLETMGYKNIKEESYPFFCCDKNDSMLFSTGFSATDKDGEKTTGCLCSAMFKGVTIRFE